MPSVRSVPASTSLAVRTRRPISRPPSTAHRSPITTVSSSGRPKAPRTRPSGRTRCGRNSSPNTSRRRSTRPSTRRCSSSSPNARPLSRTRTSRGPRRSRGEREEGRVLLVVDRNVGQQRECRFADARLPALRGNLPCAQKLGALWLQSAGAAADREQHQRAAQQGDRTWVLRIEGLDSQPPRQLELDAVAVVPAAVDGGKTPGLGRALPATAVNRDTRPAGPCRNPQPHRELARL